jgi:hypothetical protein
MVSSLFGIAPLSQCISFSRGFAILHHRLIACTTIFQVVQYFWSQDHEFQAPLGLKIMDLQLLGQNNLFAYVWCPFWWTHCLCFSCCDPLLLFIWETQLDDWRVERLRCKFYSKYLPFSLIKKKRLDTGQKPVQTPSPTIKEHDRHEDTHTTTLDTKRSAHTHHGRRGSSPRLLNGVSIDGGCIYLLV